MLPSLQNDNAKAEPTNALPPRHAGKQMSRNTKAIGQANINNRSQPCVPVHPANHGTWPTHIFEPTVAGIANVHDTST
jgi:hypothetical protein